MRSISKLAAVALFFVASQFAGRASASIVSWNYSNPTSSVNDAQPTHWGWNSAEQDYDLSLGSHQLTAGTTDWNATFNTDTTGDPTLLITNSFANDTGFAWSAYDVNVLMPNNFTLSSFNVTTPGTWTASVGAEFFNGVLNEYEYPVVLSGTPDINPGDTLAFNYTIGFTGLTSYQFTEQLSPVPEPASLGILTLALAGFGSSRRLFRAAR